MCKYKVGDKVVVKKTLKFGDCYGMEGESNRECKVVDSMMKFAGKIVTISSVRNCGNYHRYYIEEDGWNWVDGMFEGLAEDKKMFTKSDLKNGDVIVRRNGSVEIAIVDLGVFITKDGWNNLKTLADDLTDGEYPIDKDWDIMKVYRPVKNYHCQFYPDNYKKGDLVFDRERDVKPVKPLYNGKVVCIDNVDNPTLYTIGKIYQFKDGYLTADNGYRYPGVANDAIHTFEEWDKWTASEFIEIKE